jgi:hypothetical protein
MSARDERIRAFGGRRGLCPPPDLVIEQMFGNALGFVLARYLPDVLGFGCFGLIGYPFGLLRGSYGL